MFNLESHNHFQKVDYHGEPLEENKIDTDPMDQFHSWINEAIEKKIHHPNAMGLATVDKKGRPSLRIVLLKKYDKNGFIFFGNYESRKGVEIKNNPQAALSFHWPQLSRQVRIEGIVRKISAKESEEYFYSRPIHFQIAALASPQSRVIRDRKYLEERFMTLSKDSPIKRPNQWGGWILKPDYFEFWQGRENRLHDRIQYSMKGKEWIIQRLAP